MRTIHAFAPLWGVWEIEKEIGHGSFGRVYCAVRREFGREYRSAVKHISIPADENELHDLYSEGLATDEVSARQYYAQALGELVREIELMYGLRGNTNIVGYEDHLIIEKQDMPGYDVFIRMELLTGLDKLLPQGGMTSAQVCKLGLDMAAALRVLADKGIVHRDIKPANILVSAEGNYKLSDFGVARQIQRMTTVMSKKGTYAYMAPEVYAGRSANATADIYSLGLVLYRLLNGGRAPFLPTDNSAVSFTDNENAHMRRLRGEPLPKPALADAALGNIICKACAFDPEDRYQSGAELGRALAAYAKKGGGSVGTVKLQPDTPPRPGRQKKASGESIVFWERSGSRYHSDPDCAQIIQCPTVYYGTIEEAAAAGHFEPCGSCAKIKAQDAGENKPGDDESTIYWERSGSFYHSDPNCAQIIQCPTVYYGTIDEAAAAGHFEPCGLCAKIKGQCR